MEPQVPSILSYQTPRPRSVWRGLLRGLMVYYIIVSLLFAVYAVERSRWRYGVLSAANPNVPLPAIDRALYEGVLSPWLRVVFLGMGIGATVLCFRADRGCTGRPTLVGLLGAMGLLLAIRSGVAVYFALGEHAWVWATLKGKRAATIVSLGWTFAFIDIAISAAMCLPLFVAPLLLRRDVVAQSAGA